MKAVDEELCHTLDIEQDRLLAKNNCKIIFANINLKDLMPNDAELVNGKPVFAGTTVRMELLFDHIQAGNTLDEFLDDFPTVSMVKAMAVLKIAQSKLEM